MLLTQRLFTVSVFISCFMAHKADVWVLGAQGYFSTQSFINLSGTCLTCISQSHNAHKCSLLWAEKSDVCLMSHLTSYCR